MLQFDILSDYFIPLCVKIKCRIAIFNKANNCISLIGFTDNKGGRINIISREFV